MHTVAKTLDKSYKVSDGIPVFSDNLQTGGIPVFEPNVMRLIPTLAGSQYGTFSYTFTDTGKIKHTYATTQTGVEYDLSDGYTVTAGNVFSTPAAVTDILVDDVSVGLGGAAPNDGKIHVVTFVVNAGAAIAYLWQDGASSAFFVGQYLSFELIDTSTASDIVINNFVFDSGSDLYQLPRGESLGVEKVINGTFDTNTDSWTDSNATLSVANSALRLTADANGSIFATQPFTTIVGKTYELRVDMVADVASGSPSIYIGTTAFGGQTLNKGIVAGNSYSFTFVPTTTTSHITVLAGAATLLGETADFDNVSIRQLPDLACLLTNFATTDWEVFRLDPRPDRWEALDGSPILEIV